MADHLFSWHISKKVRLSWLYIFSHYLRADTLAIWGLKDGAALGIPPVE
jgi:hypothetical protein